MRGTVSIIVGQQEGPLRVTPHSDPPDGQPKIYVRRSVLYMMVPPNDPAVRPITGFAGKRLFVTADTVDEHHTYILVHGVTVCRGVQTYV